MFLEFKFSVIFYCGWKVPPGHGCRCGVACWRNKGSTQIGPNRMSAAAPRAGRRDEEEEAKLER